MCHYRMKSFTDIGAVTEELRLSEQSITDVICTYVLHSLMTVDFTRVILRIREGFRFSMTGKHNL